MGREGPSGAIGVDRTVLVCALLAAQPLAAEVVHCDLDGVALDFEIDRTQFVDGYAGDPPRRKVSRVSLGDEAFDAEPILLDGQVGFHGAGALFLVRDGAGRWTDMTDGTVQSGPCEVR